MRLHNRQIKAAFWTDTDLIRHLDRDGRMLYMGSIQLADDSGCLEDDPLAFKLHLYPGDMDVDIDFIQQRRDKLVEMGKFIPYESCGKKCLFIKNFHKHQSLKNPAPPEVPLPKWLTWEPYKSNPKAGKYILDNKVLSEFLESSYEVLKPFLQPEPEPEKEPEINNDDDNNARADKPNLYHDFEKEFGRPLGPMETEQIRKWESDMGSHLVRESLRKAVLHGKFNCKYIDSILLEWKKNNVRTLAEVEAYDQEFERSKLRKGGKARGPTGKDVQRNGGQNKAGQSKKGKYSGLIPTVGGG